MPPAKVSRRLPVVAHWDAQDVRRHIPWIHNCPGTIVPGTGVPVVVLINPIHPIVKEIVGGNPRSIIDRIPRNRNEFRVHRHVDADAYIWRIYTDAHLSFG